MITVSKDTINSVEGTIRDFRSELDKVMGTHNSGNVQDIKIQVDRVDFGMWSDDVKNRLEESLSNTSRQLDVMADSFSSGNLKNMSDNTDLILEEIENYKALKGRYNEVVGKISGVDKEDETKKTYLSNLNSTKGSLSKKMDGTIETIKQYVQRYSTYDFEGNGTNSNSAAKIDNDTSLDAIPEETTDPVQPKGPPDKPTEGKPYIYGENPPEWYHRDPALDGGSVGKYQKVMDRNGVVAYKVMQANDAFGIGGIFGEHCEGYVFVVPTTDGGYQYNYIPASALGDSESAQVSTLESYILSGAYMKQDTVVYKAVGDRTSDGQAVPLCVHSTQSQTGSISEATFNHFVGEAQSNIKGGNWARDCYFDAYGRSTIGCQYNYGYASSLGLSANTRGGNSGVPGQY